MMRSIWEEMKNPSVVATEDDEMKFREIRGIGINPLLTARPAAPLIEKEISEEKPMVKNENASGNQNPTMVASEDEMKFRERMKKNMGLVGSPRFVATEDEMKLSQRLKQKGSMNPRVVATENEMKLRERIARPAARLIGEEMREELQPTKNEVMLLFICSSILDKLSSYFLVNELELVGFVRDELVNLQTVLSKVQKVLEDLSTEALIKDDETNSVQNWLKLLEGALYDADDLLDALVTETSILKLEEEKKKQLLIKSNLSSVKTIKVKMREVVDVLYETGYKLGTKVIPIEPLALLFKQFQKREEEIKENGVVAKSYVFGRDDDIQAISSRLLFESDDDNDDASDGSVPVVAICGMGGIGKTTLARFVYDSELVKNHFDIRVWVDVRLDFKVLFVIVNILKSMGTGGAFDAISSLTWDQRLTRIQQLLYGKKFLIVLDDVWSLNHSKWNVLLSALQVRGSAGSSKILVTTRNQSVASIIGETNPPYNLKLLSDENCWLLFKQTGSVLPSLAISIIRREIVQRCRGLPLAAKALGSLLCSNTSQNEWYHTIRSEVWDLLQEDMNSLVLPVLKLSYDQLPGHLKLCFVYCSLFPKGFHFDKDELVLLWMAEGFVQPDRENSRMEDIASSYFEELLSRSFFEVSRADHLNDSPRFKIHNLIHELARFLAKTHEFFLMEENNSLHIPKGARHSSLLSKQCGTSMFETFYGSKGLRTLLLLGVHNTHIDRLPRDLFLHLKKLRVLDLSHSSLIDVPNSIGNLLHLRYLNLSHTHVKVLPDSISNLYNLQTLRLSNCSELVAMPRRTRKLFNLRHLQLDSVSRLFSMPEKIGMLTSLQTLTVFVVGRESGHRIGELKELIELRGELQILKLENVASLEEAEEAMLQAKKYLHKLELRWAEFQGDGVEDILKGLQPPSSLKELQIVCYGGSQFPFWIADPKFLHLVSISLYNCIKCQVLPPLGQLPRLKYLRIDGMDGVKNIDYDFCGGDQGKGFPELEMLTFKGMTDLEEWQGVVEGDIPMLRELMIAGCSNLRQLPELIIFKDLQDLEISLCPELASLPEKGMPTTLRSLTIRDCPKIKEHLQNAGGKDWQKIEHIPTIWID